MANKVLEIVIRAKDEATKTLEGLSKTLKDNEKDLKSVSIGAGIAFAGIAAFAGNAIKSASEAQAVQAQLGAVIKSTGGIAGVSATQATELADSLMKVTSFGDEAILSAENMLLTFTNIGKDVFPQTTQTVLDMSVALGQDLKSSSIQVGKALNDPIDGISALSRVGVKFTDQQKKMIETMVNAGDTMGAQKVILEELAKEFGGSASAEAQTFGGQIKQINELIGEFNQAVGESLMPLLKDFSVSLKPVIESITQWVQEHPQLTSAIILATLAVSGLVFVVTALSVAFLALSATPFGLMILGIGIAITLTLIPIIMLLIQHWDDLKEGAITAFNNIGETILLFTEATKATFVGWITWAKVWWNDIKIGFKDMIDGIVGFFEPLFTAIDKVKSSLSSIGDSVKGAVSTVTNKLKGKASGGGVQMGNSYMVGENGPEMFTPASNGSITPNHSLSGVGSGYNLTINMNGGTYLDDNVAEKIGDKIIQNFKRIVRF